MSTELSQNRNCRLLLPSLCALMLLSGWPGTSEADPLRRIDQIKAELAAPNAHDMRAFAGQPMRRGLLHHHPPDTPFRPDRRSRCPRSAPRTCGTASAFR